MKILAINGSPRKTWNTATLLRKVLDGASSRGAETGLVHLYDLNYQGCTSCFACKIRDGKSYGHCALQDDLTPILNDIAEVDALILGSPIYFGCVTGMMRSCMERLLFASMTYTNPPGSLIQKKIPTAFVYTMNIAEHQIKDYRYEVLFQSNEAVMSRLFGGCESLFSYETRQFEDYGKMVFSMVDPEERVKKAAISFPQGCEKAYELGVRLVP